MSEIKHLSEIIEIRKSIDVFTKDSEGHKYPYVYWCTSTEARLKRKWMNL